MKFRVNFKTPDAVEYAIASALQYEEPRDVDSLEDKRVKLEETTTKYVKYGESVTIEFDTDTNTATVIPVR